MVQYDDYVDNYTIRRPLHVVGLPTSCAVDVFGFAFDAGLPVSIVLNMNCYWLCCV